MVRKLSKTIEIDFHKLRRALWGKSTEVAQVLGIAPQSLSRKLQEHHKLTLDELNQIALHLGKDASDFLLFKSTQTDEANHPEEVIMDAMNVAQNIRQSVKEFKESIGSTFEQLLGNESEADQVEIIKTLENLLQHSGSKVAISLDQLLENRSEAERVVIIKALENLLQNCGLKAAISPELLGQLLENRSEAERVEIIKVFGEIPQDGIASGLEEKSGFTHLTIDEIVLLSDNGVEIEWLKALRELGFTHLTADEIVRLSDNGVEIEWLKGIRELGFIHFTVDEIVRLSDNGVEIEWLKGIRELGLIGEHTDGDHHTDRDHHGDDHDDSHDDDHDS